MIFDNNVPEWKNEGSDPPDTLKEEGFTAGYKPPAAYFNWFFNRIQKSVKEIQEKLGKDLKAMAFKEDIKGEDISETVIETLDTVEEKYPVPAAGETMKVFAGKVKKFIEDSHLAADLELYVSVSTGSDTTGDGSELNPYDSITKALDTIPKNLNGFVPRIYVSGGVYLESVNIANYTNGHLEIYLLGDVTITDLTIDNSYVIWQGQDGTYTLTTNYIQAVDSAKCSMYTSVNVSVVGSILDSDRNVSILAWKYAEIYMSGIVSLQGNIDLAVRSQLFSRVCLNNVNGTGFTIGFQTYNGGQINCYNNHLSATTMYNFASTGIVVKSGGAVIGTLMYDRNIYVSPTGSDTTGNGSQSYPFRTIQFAIDSLPKDLGGYAATIIPANGTYAENVKIPGFHNGLLNILSPNPNALSTDVSISGKISVVYCHAVISLRGLNITDTTNTAAIEALYCESVYLHYVNIVGSASDKTGIYGGVCNKLRIYYCRISNRNRAVDFIDTIGYVWGCSGSGNNVCLSSGGASTMHLETSNTISGYTPRQVISGGQFIESNGTQISNMITSGLSCTWGTITGGYIRHGNANGVAMITVTIRIALTATLTSGNIYLISGFPLPNAPQSTVACSCTNADLTKQAYLNASGLNFVPLVTVTGGALHFNCTYLTNS